MIFSVTIFKKYLKNFFLSKQTLANQVDKNITYIIINFMKIILFET